MLLSGFTGFFSMYLSQWDCRVRICLYTLTYPCVANGRNVAEILFYYFTDNNLYVLSLLDACSCLLTCISGMGAGIISCTTPFLSPKYISLQCIENICIHISIISLLLVSWMQCKSVTPFKFPVLKASFPGLCTISIMDCFYWSEACGAE